MENKKHKKKVAKPKNRFTLCCFCLDSSSSEIDLKVPLEETEKYDYVVEKLAIKKVPISLFATEEDLAEMKKINESGTVGDYTYTPRDKKSAMVFSSYYSQISKGGKNSQSDNEIKRAGYSNKSYSNSSFSGVKFQENSPNFSTRKPLNYNNIQQTTECVAPVFKEYHEFPVSVEVHSEPNVEAETKKFLKLTPQLQETLNELGAKQRPSGSPSIQHRVVSRPSNEIQVVNEVKENEPPFRSGHQVFSAMLEEGNDIPRTASLHQRIFRKIFPSQSKQDTRKSEENLVIKRNSSTKSTEPKESSHTSVKKNQKWKIIIKEHEERDKGNATTQQESSGSSSEYSSDTGSASETD